jgi:hypothetical protein
MPSKADICNRALVTLGDVRISTLSEDTPQARRCNVVYEEARQTVLSDHPWNCCTKRARLARSTTAPVYQFAYRYSLPSDCLRVLSVYNDPEYQIEGKFLVTDLDDVYILYVADIDDPNQYIPALREVLSLYIEAKLTYAATESTSKEQAAWGRYEAALVRARGIDAREGTPTNNQPNSWVRAFHRGSTGMYSIDDIEV